MPIVEENRTVTANGRVVVPWVVQRALGLEHGGPVRFRVEQGIVTVLAVDAGKSETAANVDGLFAPRTDIRAALAAELKTVLTPLLGLAAASFPSEGSKWKAG